MATDYTNANALGEDAHKKYEALRAGMENLQVSAERRATLKADWQAAHTLWWDELDRLQNA